MNIGDQDCFRSMVPNFMPIQRRIRETAEVVTIEFAAPAPGNTERCFKPGQFNMLYVFGVGEIPVSISSDADTGDRFAHTIRAVGAVSGALTELKRHDLVGIRGPFGNSWPVEEARQGDVLVIASGLGFAPLRPVVYHLLNHRERYGRVALVYGARYPKDLLFRPQLNRWRRTPDLQVRVTLSRAGHDWTGDVGYVTQLMPKVRLDPIETIAMICGPEVMIRSAAVAAEDMGIPADQIYVSLERNMKCAVGLCGHCQFGPYFLCKDGPVFRYDRIRSFLMAHEV